MLPQLSRWIPAAEPEAGRQAAADMLTTPIGGSSMSIPGISFSSPPEPEALSFSSPPQTEALSFSSPPKPEAGAGAAELQQDVEGPVVNLIEPSVESSSGPGRKLI
jgi:hypothetical protein